MQEDTATDIRRQRRVLASGLACFCLLAGARLLDPWLAMPAGEPWHGLLGLGIMVAYAWCVDVPACWLWCKIADRTRWGYDDGTAAGALLGFAILIGLMLASGAIHALVLLAAPWWALAIFFAAAAYQIVVLLRAVRRDDRNPTVIKEDLC